MLLDCNSYSQQPPTHMSYNSHRKQNTAHYQFHHYHPPNTQQDNLTHKYLPHPFYSNPNWQNKINNLQQSLYKYCKKNYKDRRPTQ